MTCRALLLLATVAMLAGCRPSMSSPDCSAMDAASVDRCLRLNQIQLLGTHNSYHLAPEPALLGHLGERGRNLEYTHRPLLEQLEALGIRQFEIDVFADPDGGHYAAPVGHRLAASNEPLADALRGPGFKVLHVPDFDYRSTCPTLAACLTTLRDWSLAHPRHLPVLVMIEVKDGPRQDPDGLGLVQPLPFDTDMLLQLDGAIRAVFDESHLLTPDHVRGRHATLPEALRVDGWPRLGEARGKVLFALDNTGEHRLRYLEGAPALEGRVLFVSSPPGEPSAAFLKLNDALGEGQARIREMVAAGYLVRTRADEPTHEARSGDTTRRDSAFASGAQLVSTDYPEPSPFGSGYVARLPGAEARPGRCNPVNAPAGCRSEWLTEQ